MTINFDYLDTEQAAEILRVDPATVRKYIRNHINKVEGKAQLKAHKVGKNYLIDPKDLHSFIKSR